jgi:hypothetical protein
MNELERSDKNPDAAAMNGRALTPIEVYDQYGSMAYGIILQMVPQPHIAQEILVSVFSSPLLLACNSYPFTFAVCVIKLARAKAVEAKRRLGQLAVLHHETASLEKFPELVFDLSFRQGYTPDEVAEQLQLPKTEVLKAFHEFFKSTLNV